MKRPVLLERIFLEETHKHSLCSPSSFAFIQRRVWHRMCSTLQQRFGMTHQDISLVNIKRTLKVSTLNKNEYMLLDETKNDAFNDNRSVGDL